MNDPQAHADARPGAPTAARPDPRPDVIVIMTDQERATPAYEPDSLARWRHDTLTGRRWFDEHAVSFDRHYTGSLACVPSRPTLFTGQYPDVHGVTQTDGLGKLADDTRLRWLREGEVPTLGHWFRAAGYDTHYDGKWHISHADLIDPRSGQPVRTNNSAGEPIAEAVQAYLDADPLDPYGFSGWVGPEPHGGALGNSGLRRDPLIAARVVAWLTDRYERRARGDADALRPFLLVASFVNPHDIVLFPAWVRQGNPLGDEPSPLDPPHVPPSPTDDEDLRTKPAAQVAYRAAYASGYGPTRLIERAYRKNEQRYRDLYYRLHAEVDGPLDRVRRTVTDHAEADPTTNAAVIVRTADHGELLGAHGGLHQKWFNLYDEATRVPFQIVRVGGGTTPAPRRVGDAPTSHVDLVPTLLGAAGIDEVETAAALAPSFTELHPLPGRDLMPVVDGGDAARDRPVYLMTRDNMLEGDSGASAVARARGRGANPPRLARIQVPAHVAANFEGLVVRVPAERGGRDHLWKLTRAFDDPATWTEPHVRHVAADGPTGVAYRTEPIADEWELYDLDDDPIERHNRWRDEPVVFAHLVERLADERARAVPPRNQPWEYATWGRRPRPKRPPRPARAARRVLGRLGLHPDDDGAVGSPHVTGRALCIATNHATLDIGKPTGVFASELTVPYYAFLDAGMDVDVASPLGGEIPVDPQSLKPAIRTADDDRFLADDDLRAKITSSLAIADLNVADYDLVYLAGGWGAAFDLGVSDALGEAISTAARLDLVIGGVCHGPLGLRLARTDDGRPLVEGRRVSAVTDKQVRELGIESTPYHPETELRALGAEFESATKFRDVLANHWVVDGNLVTGQNQNAGPMVAREMLRLVAARTLATT